MEQVGFPLTDPLFALVDAADDAVHRLNIHVHYMTCDGVGDIRGGRPRNRPLVGNGHPVPARRSGKKAGDLTAGAGRVLMRPDIVASI
jgi:hypothetical protein